MVGKSSSYHADADDMKLEPGQNETNNLLKVAVSLL